MALYHFSDDASIDVFEPRPVLTPVARPGGQEWLNGSLVWAIDEAHAFLYFFPRECPRILIWTAPTSSPHDTRRWFGESISRVVAYIEPPWQERLKTATIHRYEFSEAGFIDVDDAGMHVSRNSVRPVDRRMFDDIPALLAGSSVDLRVVDRLTAVRAVFDSTLEVSGIRLRNAAGWGDPPGWRHARA